MLRYFVALAGVGMLLACCEPRPVPDSNETRARGPARHDVLRVARSASAVGSANAGGKLVPLAAEWLVRFGRAPREVVVTPPVGADEPRRVVIAVHGAGDRPDWACGGWRLASGARSFVVCPAGTWSGQGWYAWASSAAIEQAIDEALALTRQRFGAYLADTPSMYAGFSQGAIMAEPILRKRARELPIAILAEGGYVFASSPSFARAYREAGGRRVALVCGSGPCFMSAERSRQVLERAGLQVLIVGDAKAGHNLNGRMQSALRAAWPEISAPL